MAAVGLPSPELLPTLHVPATNNLDTTSSLASAALKHLLFARGQTAQPVAALTKEHEAASLRRDSALPPNQARRPQLPRLKRDRARQELLDSLQQLDQRIVAAVQHSSAQPSLPLLVIFGKSPLSPLEVYYISLRLPTDGGAGGLCAPTSAKIVSAAERKLIRFLISTEELQQAFSKPLRPTRMFLFTLRATQWTCPGWKMRRGFKIHLDRMAHRRESQHALRTESDADAGAASADGSLTCQSDTTSSSTRPRAVDQTIFDLARHLSSPLQAPEEDLNAMLSECLSPLRKQAPHQGMRGTDQAAPTSRGPLQSSGCQRPVRPALISRSSWSVSATFSSVDLSFTGASSSAIMATPARRRALVPKRLAIWASPAPPMPMPGRLTCLSSSRAGIISRWTSITDEDTGSDDAKSGAGDREDHMLLLGSRALASPHHRSEEDDSSRPKDERPRGARLFPTNADPEKSLLLRNRIRGKDRSSSAARGVSGTFSTPVKTRGYRAPKSVAFCLDCSSGSNHERDAVRCVSHETLAADLCWFQCEVNVTSFL